MPPDERVVALLYDMLESAQLAVSYCADRTRSDLDRDLMFADALVRRIQVIGEAARGVSKGFREAHPEIQWQPITGTRHVLVHEYRDVNFNVIWRIVQVYLPQLIQQLEAILNEAPPPPIVEE